MAISRDFDIGHYQCRHLANQYKQPIYVRSLSVSPNSDESGKQFLYPDGYPDRHQNLIILFIGPLPTFPENFIQILSEVFA